MPTRIILTPAPNLLVFSVPAAAVLGFPASGPSVPIGLNLAPSRENGYEVFRVPGHIVLSSQEQKEVKLAFDIAVHTSETGKRCNKSARDLVDGLCITVGDYILPEFERFFVAYGPGF